MSAHLYTDLKRCIRCGVSEWASGGGLWSARAECHGQGTEEFAPDRPPRGPECPTYGDEQATTPASERGDERGGTR